MSALEKSTRRKIFYGMVALFAAIAPMALLYSQGYIINLRSRGLVATGGIFVKTIQPGTRVSIIEADVSKETSFIAHGALITDLLPKRYTVRVEKDGYQPWQKVVRVSNEEVLEFRNVLLPPATITPRAMTSLPGKAPGRMVALAGRSELAIETRLPGGQAGDPARSVTLTIVAPESGAITARIERVAHWSWDQNSGTFIIGRMVNGRLRWYRVSLLPGGNTPEGLISFRGLPAGFSADRVLAHPTEPGDFYFSAGGALFLQGRSNVPIPIAEQIHSYAISRDHIYLVSKNGFFAASNLTGGDTEVLGRKGLFLDTASPARIVIGPGGDAAVFDAAGGLFLYRPGRDQELNLIAGGIRGADFAPSGDRLLFWDEQHLFMYWLKDNPAQPFDLAGTKKQIFYSEAPIRQAYLNTAGSQALYATDRGIRMVETDDRASVNSYDLVSAPVGAFVLDSRTLDLSWIGGATLFRASVR